MTRPATITARAAIDELRAIRSTDPCAGRALAAVKAAALTLERYWPDDPDDAPAVAAPAG